MLLRKMKRKIAIICLMHCTVLVFLAMLLKFSEYFVDSLIKASGQLLFTNFIEFLIFGLNQNLLVFLKTNLFS